MGLVFVLVAGPRHVVLPLALGATVLVSSYVFQVPPYWRTAPTTAALVVASSLERESRKIGLEISLHSVAEVMLGSFMAVVVASSWPGSGSRRLRNRKVGPPSPEVW